MMIPIRYLYPCLLLTGAYLWWVSVSDYGIAQLLSKYWSSALTMLLGSFVAGSTPLGGGAVAFPVLTKVLNIDTEQAKVFGLFIQSVGMTFATALFISLKIKVNWKWLAWLLPTSILGLLLGLFYISVSSQHIRLFLSIFVVTSGIFLVKIQSNPYCTQHAAAAVPPGVLILLGFPAGILSALVGTGADALLFFCVVLIFRHPIKKTIPTTVAYMAMCSLIGSFMLFMSEQIPVSTFTINSWIVAAPVVAVGAPLGGFIMTKVNPRHLLLFIKTIILSEGITTLMLVDLALLERWFLSGLILAAIVYLISRWKTMTSIDRL